MKIINEINTLLGEGKFTVKWDNIKPVKKITSAKGLKDGDKIRVALPADDMAPGTELGYYEFKDGKFKFVGANFSPSDFGDYSEKEFFIEFADSDIFLLK